MWSVHMGIAPVVGLLKPFKIPSEALVEATPRLAIQHDRSTNDY
jgi:hypothetical protein